MPDHERSTTMEFGHSIIDAEVQRQALAERIARAQARIPATTHRHLLAQRLRRVADRIDS